MIVQRYGELQGVVNFNITETLLEYYSIITLCSRAFEIQLK